MSRPSTSCTPPDGISSEPTIATQRPALAVSATNGIGQAALLAACAGGLDDLDGFSLLHQLVQLHHAALARLRFSPFLKEFRAM